MMIALGAVSSMMDQVHKPGADSPLAHDGLVSLYNILGASLKNSKATRGFAADYYVPYFAALAQAGHTEAFVVTAWKTRHPENTSAWAGANQQKMETFHQWTQAYSWPVK